MPTIISHAVVPLALGVGLGGKTISRRLLVAGAVAAMLPDADVLGFHFHVAYGNSAGHRGMTHSLAFALLLGLIALMAAKWLHSKRSTAMLFVAGSAASHGLLDMLTNGGLGVAYFWPFTDRRFFLPWQLIDVSPFGLHILSDQRAVSIISSELLWVWLPSILFGLAFYLVRCRSEKMPHTIK